MTKVDQLIEAFKEFKEELNKNGTNCSYKAAPNATIGTSGGEGGMYRSEKMGKMVSVPEPASSFDTTQKAEAGPNPKVMSTKKPLKPSDVSDAGPSSFKINVSKDNKGATTERHPVNKDEMCGQDMMAMSEDRVKGVHVGSNPAQPGRSKMGLMNRIGATDKAKQEAKDNLKDMKRIKPKLTKHEEVIKFQNNKQWSLDKSAFKDLQHKIEHEGHSKDSAAAITASIGRKSIGEKAMEERSKEARKNEGVNSQSNPDMADMEDPRGNVRMVKDEHPVNENKEKFKVMPMTTEKPEKAESVKGKPYSDKGEVKKGDKALSADAKGYEEQNAQNKARHGCPGI